MGILGTAIGTVGSIWGVGSSIYKEAKIVISNEIDEETDMRVKKLLGDGIATKNSIAYKSAFNAERSKVKKEAKEMAGKGALMLLGFGILF